ncbi:hypothetical protein HPB52_016801 [Rhipicephalus sanguineus]|uniref:HAP1 N-terminal domain-containing protein n=1 Tax=Rhipicephalus sanguineus TaxID=34632 RepID=A0A9D4SSX8_RHISA|nr:hypothetical protein HPB52_016801 [Rhipicephalus sanguineus]
MLHRYRAGNRPNALGDLVQKTCLGRAGGWAFLAHVVSGERVSQMTRTYSDPEALTRLLEEKERDLELAAHIGQGLLREKRELACRTDALEAELLQAQESLTQLRHELALKASLLQVYTAQEEADAALPSPTE